MVVLGKIVLFLLLLTFMLWGSWCDDVLYYYEDLVKHPIALTHLERFFIYKMYFMQQKATPYSLLSPFEKLGGL